MVGGWIKAEGGCKGGGNCLKCLKRGWNRKKRKGNKDLKKGRGDKLDQGVGALKKGGLEPPYKLWAYDHDFWYTIVKWWYLQVVFSFFFVLIFQAVREVKGQKIVQNYKKFCLLCFISQESYILWLSFMVHLCEIMIFPGIFFSFSKFWFSGLLGG